MIALLLMTLTAHAASAQASAVLNDGGHYEVPVRDDLKQYAHYKMDDLVVENGRISYSLPLELTGVKNQIILNAADAGQYSGPHATAQCDDSKCHVKYKDLAIDPQLVRATLVAEGFAGADLDKRLEVARAFSGDPAGVVYFGEDDDD